MLDHLYASAFARRQQAEYVSRLHHRIEADPAGGIDWRKLVWWIAAVGASVGIWAVAVAIVGRLSA
jgi:hypothetical protein